MVIDAISKTDVCLRKELFRNIFVSGGGSNVQGFMERLCEEVQRRVGTECWVRGSAGNREDLVWLGARGVGVGRVRVGREEFGEEGEGIVRRLYGYY